MKAVLQRVNKASVVVNGETVGEIEKGLLVLLGVHTDDTEAQVLTLAKKVCELRIFEDEQEKMNLSALDLQRDILVVSNFTLYGDCSGGRRPYFVEAARPEKANPLYEKFVQEVKTKPVGKVSTGIFGADMKIDMECDGPVTIILDTASL